MAILFLKQQHEVFLHLPAKGSFLDLQDCPAHRDLDEALGRRAIRHPRAGKRKHVPNNVLEHGHRGRNCFPMLEMKILQERPDPARLAIDALPRKSLGNVLGIVTCQEHERNILES